MTPILVCGDAMVDEYWWGDVARISPEAPVPVVQVLRTEERLGAADNVAANCRRMGAETSIAACNTSRKIRLVARNQQVARIDFDEAPNEEAITAMEKLYKEYLPGSGIVIFSDYDKGSLKNIQDLIQKSTSKLVIVDPKGYNYRRYSGADLVKPNIDEMRHVVGGWGSEEQLAAKVELLRGESSIARVLLTRAAEGMTLFDGLGAHHFPAEAREVYDVTGAGDTAIAALAVSLSRGNSWHEAVHHANKAAGIAVARFGTAIVSEEEVFGTS